MDFAYSGEAEAFRKKVDDWLEANLPKGWGADAFEPEDENEAFKFHLDWQRKLHQMGWVGLMWPKEYGGGGGTLIQQVVLEEELARYKAPREANVLGLHVAGPTILIAGSEEQKKRYLPKILSGEEIWCEGFSEPEAGSDLANLRTRAVLDGDYYVINGQKVWSSYAHHADWCLLLARTATVEPKHRGITVLLLDMRVPGVEVRPLRQLTGDSEFNEIFFDNARVPKSNMVGEENRGFYIAMATLAFERTGTTQAIAFRQFLSDLVKLATQTKRNGIPAIKDPVIRNRLAQFAIECEIVKLNGLRNLTPRLKGEVPGPETMITKVFWSEMNQRMTDFAMQVIGPESTIVKEKSRARGLGKWQYSFLRSKGNTIEMGTSEILRNVIGERALGIPR